MSLRERRKRDTARALTAAARALTLERGFAGFTVEEVCVQAGVSRRTFFNYFESKENAVFGYTESDSRLHALDEAFLEGEGELLDDFATLLAHRWEVAEPLTDAAALMAVVEHEPRLLHGFFELMSRNERRDVDLVMRRAGFTDRLRAEILVQTVAALMRSCVDHLFHHDPAADFESLLRERLAVARALFAAPNGSRTPDTTDPTPPQKAN